MSTSTIWPYSQETCDKAATWCKENKINWKTCTADERRMIVDEMEKRERTIPPDGLRPDVGSPVYQEGYMAGLDHPAYHERPPTPPNVDYLNPHKAPQEDYWQWRWGFEQCIH